MEFVILGMLMIRNLTQYDIRSILQRKISPFFSASLGSIQAAFKKLEANAHVEQQVVTENGRRKKIYSINEEGRRHFLEWMTMPAAPSRLDQEVTTRLFFLGLMPPKDRLAIVNAVVSRLETAVREFEAANTEAVGKEVDGPAAPIARFQLKTLELGLFYHHSMLQWFQGLLKELEQEVFQYE